MYKVLIISLMLFFSQLSASAQIEWQLSTDNDGVRIYTSQVPASKVKAVKVECELNATPSQLVALLMDVKSSPDWIYHTKTCSLIKQLSPMELYYYSEVSLPWPAENRDFVAHLKVTQNPDTRVVTVDGPSVNGHFPEKSGIVRINNAQGKWVITPLTGDRIKVVYTLHVEPGGSVPAWMVNMFATQGPQQIFKKLKQQIQKPRYKDAVLPYVENVKVADITPTVQYPAK